MRLPDVFMFFNMVVFNIAKRHLIKIVLRLVIMVNRLMTDNKFRDWLKRVGFLGFMFFLIKGLMWIAVIYYGVRLF